MCGGEVGACGMMCVCVPVVYTSSPSRDVHQKQVDQNRMACCYSGVFKDLALHL